MYIIFLNILGLVDAVKKVSATFFAFQGYLFEANDQFGFSVAWQDDVDGAVMGKLAVGAVGVDDGGIDSGAVRSLSGWER